MSFEIPFEDRYWESVRERMEDHPLEDEHEDELDVLSDAMYRISMAVRMIRDACEKVDCKNCDFWDGEDGCALKVKEWNA